MDSIFDLVVSDSLDYWKKKGKTEKEIEDFIESKEGRKADELISEILALEVAIYASRRLSGGSGSTVDYLNKIRREKIKLFESSFEKFEDFNEDVDF